MPRSLNSPDRLFDRTWRAGHPFCRRLSAGRRWGMISLFILLGLIIGGYWYVTDSNRVKLMAENYLSGLLGGRVVVGRATLSIFEGLRLDDVRVYGRRKVGEKIDEDASLFSAQAFLIQYNPQTLFSGKLEATRIVAIDPRVHLTENVETGKWSFQRLNPKGPHPSMAPRHDGRPPVLPEILLRNASVEYSQEGAGAQTPTNSISLEGQFTPTLEPDTYHFLLQSRGEIQGVGPSVDGTLVMGTNQVKARLSNFVIGPDVRAMLTAEVRKWVEDHQLAGAIDAELDYRPEDPHRRFRIEMDLGGVTATVRPEEWMGVDQVRRLAFTKQALGVLRLAGLNTPITGLTDDPYIDRLQTLLEPTPLHLDSVAGKFTFTQQGIDISGARGRVEFNGFKADGHIDGYSPSAPVHLHVTSPENESIYVPAAPRYVSSMPAPVREVYDRFKPQGRCNFWADIDRTTAGAAPVVAGQLQIVDGQFSYEKFAYPVQHVSGMIDIGPDADGLPSMKLDRIRGHGIEGGPNADADFEINGWMDPLGPEVEMHINVAGKNVVNEPALTAAYPRGAAKALRMFDAAGRGELPRYRGNFEVAVTRDRGRKSHWTIATDIHVTDAAGCLAAFPYPMSRATADVHIQGDRLDVIRATMKRGAATLKLDGSVAWGSGETSTSIMTPVLTPPAAASQPEGADFRPDLHVVATNVPIDSDLLNALPADRRAWIEKLGIGGNIDVDGTITAPATVAGSISGVVPKQSDLNLDLGIEWHDGTLAPFGGEAAATDLSGSLRLASEKLVLRDLKGKRGDADLSARGSVDWETQQPQVNISAKASNLLLDKSLYNLLPDPAKKGWDSVHPVGTADVTVDYTGIAPGSGPNVPASPTASALASSDSAADPRSADSGYAVSITPVNLSAYVDAAPYRLDNITGTLSISPDQITLNDISAHHGGATVHISGTGNLNSGSDVTGSNPPANSTANAIPTWDLRLSGDQMLVDDDLRRAVPSSLANLLQSLAMKGKVAFDFSKLSISPPPPSTQPASQAVAKATNASSLNADSNVDFAVKIKSDDASMDVGVPLSKVAGIADLAGSTRGGRLNQLTGTVDASSLLLAQRPMTDLHVELSKPVGMDLLQVQKVQGRIAGGEIAGQVEWAFPDNAPSRYAIGLVLQGADVKEMSGDKTADIHGTLNASLAVEGNYNDATSRRGRGDVAVTGSDMYHIPLVLGLLQITNLSLPITSPFSEATARYSIEGQRVTFEQIELRAKEMMMQGTGHLDFDTKRVSMVFTTDNTTWPKLPIIGDLISSARHELLQINVAGTLQAPKVSATAMNTFTTTVDQVLQGGSSDTTPDGKQHKGY
jgi:hypothetical protein